MKRSNEKHRSPLMVGAVIVLTSVLLVLMFFAAHLRADTSNHSGGNEVELCTSNTLTSTTPIITTMSKTTTRMRTTTTTAVTTSRTTAITSRTTASATEAPTMVVTEATQPDPKPEVVTPVEQPVEQPAAPPVEQPAEQPVATSGLPITDYERTLLRNVVAREYGSNNHGYGGPPVTLYERACVVAVVMNRVNSPSYPNTIEGVLTQPYQFSGYYACNYEWSNVTQSVRDSVDYYFAHQSEFPYYMGFWGDGAYNHFY